jgi:hypothetical protein
MGRRVGLTNMEAKREAINHEIALLRKERGNAKHDDEREMWQLALSKLYRALGRLERLAKRGAAKDEEGKLQAYLEQSKRIRDEAMQIRVDRTPPEPEFTSEDIPFTPEEMKMIIDIVNRSRGM